MPDNELSLCPVCGSRWFVIDGNFMVTCRDGRAFKLTGMFPVSCVICGGRYLYPATWPSASGPKRLIPMREKGDGELIDLLDRLACDELRAEREGDPPYHKADPQDCRP